MARMHTLDIEGPVSFSRCKRLSWVCPYICNTCDFLDLKGSPFGEGFCVKDAISSLKALGSVLESYRVSQAEILMKREADWKTKELGADILQTGSRELSAFHGEKKVRELRRMYVEDPGSTFVKCYVRNGSVEDSLSEVTDSMDRDAWKDVQMATYCPRMGMIFYLEWGPIGLSRVESHPVHWVDVTWLDCMIRATKLYVKHLEGLARDHHLTYPLNLSREVRGFMESDEHRQITLYRNRVWTY